MTYKVFGGTLSLTQSVSHRTDMGCVVVTSVDIFTCITVSSILASYS